VSPNPTIAEGRSSSISGHAVNPRRRHGHPPVALTERPPEGDVRGGALVTMRGWLVLMRLASSCWESSGRGVAGEPAGPLPCGHPGVAAPPRSAGKNQRRFSRLHAVGAPSAFIRSCTRALICLNLGCPPPPTHSNRVVSTVVNTAPARSSRRRAVS